MLTEALDSLNKQTYKNFDVFIVFDECWYNTNIIVKDVYDFKINRLYHEKKEGLSAAKNFGLEHITSEWVGFLDADDLYMPKKLEMQVDFIKENDIDFLGTQAYNKIQGQKNLFDSCFKLGMYENHEQIKFRLDTENILTHGSMLIKKSCLDMLNGYSNIKGMEDWDMWKRAIRNGYIFHQLQYRLYVYTIGSSVAR
jgi:glycosyltransferase involved in cell wall biosynthesis